MVVEARPDALAPGDIGLVKPGTIVFIPATKKADGALEADLPVAGKDGVDPPM